MLEASRRLGGEQLDQPGVQLVDHGYPSDADMLCSF